MDEDALAIDAEIRSYEQDYIKKYREDSYMNWIIAQEYEEYECLTGKENLSETEESRLQELENNIQYYERTYKGGD